MEELLEQIAEAGHEEIEILLHAVLRRYGALYPEWEISVISLERTGDQAEQLDNIIRRLEWMKDRLSK